MTWYLISLLLNHIQLYGCTTVCVSIHLLKSILAISNFCHLGIFLLWIFTYRFCVDVVFKKVRQIYKTEAVTTQDELRVSDSTRKYRSPLKNESNPTVMGSMSEGHRSQLKQLPMTKGEIIWNKINMTVMGYNNVKIIDEFILIYRIYCSHK